VWQIVFSSPKIDVPVRKQAIVEPKA